MTQDQSTNLKLLSKIDAGGMAEVFKAERYGAEHIGRLVAVKRILPHLNKHKKFVSMFLDEARLAMKLSHSNIVQTFEVGLKDGSYFIVMEFIEGTSLKQIIKYHKDRKKLIPKEVAIYIVMEAAKGLAYAHSATDDNGKPLKIVHRDVSPPNILISKQGEVKVVDFGLAKAASQLEETEPGIIKGKFSYLAPETVMGLEIDYRADIFSLGIILFELLTGRRLFYGASDLETVKLVEKAHIPKPSALNPEIPSALEMVIYKALARDRDKRYQTTEDLWDALNSILFTFGLKVGNKELAALVKQTTENKQEKYEDLSLDDDALFTGDFTLTETKTGDISDNQAKNTQTNTEDPRNWMSDMGLDDLFDEEDMSEPVEIEEISEIEELELSPDDIEEVLETDAESKVFKSGSIENTAPAPLEPSAPNGPPQPPATPQPNNPQQTDEIPQSGDKNKKSWFSKFFGGDDE